MVADFIIIDEVNDVSPQTYHWNPPNGIAPNVNMGDWRMRPIMWTGTISDGIEKKKEDPMDEHFPNAMKIKEGITGEKYKTTGLQRNIQYGLPEPSGWTIIRHLLVDRFLKITI